MLLEDPSRTHVHSSAAVDELFESTNQPVVQPSGRAAQPAQAVVLAVDEGGSLRVLVVLTLTGSQENVIYTATELVADAELATALEEALTFAESMGFILDGTGWSHMDFSARDALAGRLPAFHAPTPKEKAKALDRKPTADPLASVARLLAAFSFALLVSLGACGGMSAEQRAKSAEINYDLGTNSLSNGDAQGALVSYLQSEKDEPDFPQVHNALGLLYGFSLGRPADAEVQFKQAIELKPDFSEADNNYGAFLLSRDRFAEAIPHFEQAIANPLYRDRTVAACNLAWALYKTGAVDRAIAQLRSALRVDPKFCKGWRQLGTIFSDRGALDDSLDAYQHYAESCPDAADAQLQIARIFVRESKVADAKKALDRCVSVGHTADPSLASECTKELRGLGAP